MLCQAWDCRVQVCGCMGEVIWVYIVRDMPAVIFLLGASLTFTELGNVHCTIWSCLECNNIILVPVVLNWLASLPCCPLLWPCRRSCRGWRRGRLSRTVRPHQGLTADWRVDHDEVPHEIENITYQLVLNVMDFLYILVYLWFRDTVVSSCPLIPSCA